MLLNDNHTFILNMPSGAVQVYPTISSLEYSFEEDDELCAMRQNLDTELIFKNDKNGVKIFDELFKLEIDKGVCYDVELEIKRKCDDGIEHEAFKGFINFNDGSFDCDTCVARLKVIPDDPYTCITDGWEEDVDLFVEFPSENVEVTNLVGEKQCIIFTENVFNVPISQIGYYISQLTGPPGPGYVITYTNVTINTSANNPNFGDLYFQSTYCRQCSPDPLPGWMPDSGQYYFPVPVGPLTLEFQAPSSQIWSSNTGDGIELDNGVYFNDVIERWLNDCNVCSDFFGINPDGTAPNNIAYQYATNYLQNIAMFQPSDVIKASASQNATRFVINYKELWENIKKLFNLKWLYDKDKDCLRLEHITYRTNSKIINLTKDEYAPFLEGMHNYSKDNEDFPKREMWTMGISTLDTKFNNSIINYTNNCATGEEEKCEIELIGSDIASMYDNEDYQGSDFESSGIVLVATDGNGTILNNNEPLAIQCITENLHLWDRPFIEGVMNGNIYTFLGVKKNKNQDTITIPLCCSQFYSEFTPDMDVRTKLSKYFGLAEIKEARYLEPSEKLELSLKYC